MKRARVTGSAHAGLIEWLLQRVTSIYLAGFAVYAVVYFSLQPVRDYDAWKGWFASGLVRLAWALLIASVLIHTWVGLRSIYFDYIHPLWLRFGLTLLTGLGLLALALWGAEILLRIQS